MKPINRQAPTSPTSPPTTTPATLPTAMPAAIRREYGGPEVVRLEEVSRPEPGADEVLIEVDTAGLDRAVLHLLTGLPTMARAVFGLRRPRDIVLGGEVAGRVVAIGGDVTDLAVGDRVAGTASGSFATYAVAHPGQLAHVPETVTTRDAATVGVSGVTAWEAVTEQGQIGANQRVLILGASGGVGSFAVQLAKHREAHVTAVCSKAKSAYVTSLGADAVFDYTTTSLADLPGPFDVVLDLAGNHALSSLRRRLTRDGRLVIIGGEGGGRVLGGIERNLLASVTNLVTPQHLGWFVSRTTSQRIAQVLALCESGALRAPIDHTVDLAGVPDALRAMAAGTLCGKVVVLPRHFA